MKLNLPLFAALLAMIPIAGNAFTLDAAGYDGGELPQDPAAIEIVGYGEVVFEAVDDEAIMVSSGYLYDTLPPNPDLDFDPAKTVRIVLNDRGTRTAGFVFAGLPVAEKESTPLPVQHDFSVAGTEVEVARPYGVPETASALLGLVGTALLLLRRLR